MEAISETLEGISFLPYFFALFVVVLVVQIERDKILFLALKVIEVLAAISILLAAISSWYINYHLGFGKSSGFFMGVIISSPCVLTFAEAFKKRLQYNKPASGNPASRFAQRDSQDKSRDA
jgi:Na+-transporting NADH:ubiquinone oxidoreductase subunit NqrD